MHKSLITKKTVPKIISEIPENSVSFRIVTTYFIITTCKVMTVEESVIELIFI